MLLSSMHKTVRNERVHAEISGNKGRTGWVLTILMDMSTNAIYLKVYM